MDLDDEICLCFHVTKRKVINYIRVQRPQRVGQLSDCFGAGTGCGWCRPFLQQLFDQLAGSQQGADSLPTAEQYEQMRARYLKQRDDAPPR